MKRNLKRAYWIHLVSRLPLSLPEKCGGVPKGAGIANLTARRRESN